MTESTAANSLPRPFEDYRLLISCGCGAFGEVYVAEDIAGTRMALKILPKSPAADRELAGLRRYRSLAGEHPNLIRIHHIGTTAMQIYYTMDLADNLAALPDSYSPDTLENRIRKSGRLAPEAVLKLAGELLAGLEFLTENRLVHRDIKPANIIFIGNVAKLSDIGMVSEIEKTVSLAGTLGFMPPELLTGAGYAHESGDIYSLGKVLYCALTGESPHNYPIVPPELPLAICKQFRPLLNCACNRNPEERFPSAAAFRAALPSRLAVPGPLGRQLDKLHIRIARNRGKLCRIAATVGTLLALTVCAAALLIDHRRAATRITETARRNAMLCAEKIQDPLLDRSFTLYAPEIRDQRLAEIKRFREAIAAGEWRRAARLGAELDAELEKFARSLLARLFTEIGPAPAEFSEKEYNSRLARLQLFREPPLAGRLDPDGEKQLETAITLYRNSLREHWMGPVSGAPWPFFETPDLIFEFVPPGGFAMGTAKKFTPIPYHFWIARSEVLNRTCRAYLGAVPSLNTNDFAPVERITWNNMLTLSRNLTRNARNANLLPEGYIIRPPRESEWEYAASGAWRATPEKRYSDAELENFGWFATNSKARSKQVLGKQPNPLGLYDMLGNVSEIAIPEITRLPNMMVERGGAFRNAPNDHLWRYEWICNQQLHWCGFRLVVAPGTLDFFDRMWFTGEPQEAKIADRHFELFGGNLGCTQGSMLEQYCALLGGHPAMFDTPELRRKLPELLPLAARYPVLIDGRRSADGVWRWRNGALLPDSGWFGPKNSPDLPFLSWDRSRFAATGDRGLPLFLCEWTQPELARRGSLEHWNTPSALILKEFKIGNRAFKLLHVPGHWYTLKRICELLGGRPAVLETPELVRQALTELADTPNLTVALGGYRKFGVFQWLDGTPIAECKPLRSNPSETPGDDYVAIRNGKLGYETVFHAVLCERDLTSR